MSALFYVVAALGFIFAHSVNAIPMCPITTLELANKATTPLLRFAVDSFGQLVSKQPEKNLVFSPVSIILALAQLEAGASGGTLEEIRNFLTKGGFDVNVLGSYTSLQMQLQVDQPDTKVSVANGLFPDKSMPWNKDYENVLKNCYQSEAQVMEYKNKPEEARKKINAWVSEKTMEKIPELFKPSSLSTETQLVLANAVYFRSPWRRPFIFATRNGTFQRFGRERDNQTVQFMHTTGQYRIAHTREAQVLELLYDNINYSMIIALPKERDGLSKLHSNLTHETLQRFMGEGSFSEVYAVVPRFTIRSSTNVIDLLTNLGLGKMFSQEAQFGRMSDKPVKVSNALQEAYIKVNENGTEAAAATGIGGVPGSAPTKPINFVADHPFLYLITHKLTSAILFMGIANSIEEDLE